MAYATITDLESACGGYDKMVELTDKDQDGIPDANIVADALDEAAGEIESVIVARYQLGVPPVLGSALLRRMSARWAARVLRRDGHCPFVDDLDKEKIDRAWLADVAAGKIHLDVDPRLATPSSLSVDEVGVRSPLKTVGREKLKGFW